MTDRVKQRADSVSCQQCGRPTWSATGTCRRCSVIGPQPMAVEAAPLGPAPVPPDVVPAPDPPERWHRTERCPKCRYMLDGLPPGHRCPECGNDFGTTGLTIPAWKTRAQPSLRLIIAFTLSAIWCGFAALKNLQQGHSLGIALSGAGLVVYLFIAARWIRLYLLYRSGETEGQLVMDRAGVKFWPPPTECLWRDVRKIVALSKDHGLVLLLVMRGRGPFGKRHNFYVSCSPDEARSLQRRVTELHAGQSSDAPAEE